MIFENKYIEKIVLFTECEVRKKYNTHHRCFNKISGAIFFYRHFCSVLNCKNKSLTFRVLTF